MPWYRFDGNRVQGASTTKVIVLDVNSIERVVSKTQTVELFEDRAFKLNQTLIFTEVANDLGKPAPVYPVVSNYQGITGSAVLQTVVTPIVPIVGVDDEETEPYDTVASLNVTEGLAEFSVEFQARAADLGATATLPFLKVVPRGFPDATLLEGNGMADDLIVTHDEWTTVTLDQTGLIVAEGDIGEVVRATFNERRWLRMNIIADFMAHGARIFPEVLTRYDWERTAADGADLVWDISAIDGPPGDETVTALGTTEPVPYDSDTATILAAVQAVDATTMVEEALISPGNEPYDNPLPALSFTSHLKKVYAKNGVQPDLVQHFGSQHEAGVTNNIEIQNVRFTCIHTAA